MFLRCFNFFKKNSFIKQKVEQSQNKECKKATKVFQECMSSIQ